MAIGVARRECCEMMALAPRMSSSGIMALLPNDFVGVPPLIEEAAFDERRNADCVEALPGQQHETCHIAERIGERQDFGDHAAFRTFESRWLGSESPLLRPVLGGEA